MATKFHFCDDCGTRNTADSKYCKECGKKNHVLYQTPTLTADDQVEDTAQQERLTQFLDMAFWHTEAGNTDAAVRACNAALAIQPHSTTAHSLLGSLYEKKGDDTQAIAAFRAGPGPQPGQRGRPRQTGQIRNGVHTQPVKPSRLYHWLPPALAHFRVAGWAEKITRLPPPDMTVMPTRPNPALAAGAAAVLVLACGLFMIKPPQRARGTPDRAPSLRTRLPAPHSPPGLPTTPPRPPGANALPAPIVLGPARPGTPLLPPGSVTPSPSPPRPGPIPSPPRRPLFRPAPYSAATTRRGARNARARRARAAGCGRCPPCPLAARMSRCRLRVMVRCRRPRFRCRRPFGAATAPYAGVTRHTVVVQRFNGTPSESTPAGAGGEQQ